MPRIDDPQPDLGALRRALGLTTEEGARRLGITPEVLVHYESKGYGYDPAHDQKAITEYLVWAVAAYAPDDVRHELFPLDHTHKKKDRPAATGRPQVTSKGNRS